MSDGLPVQVPATPAAPVEAPIIVPPVVVPPVAIITPPVAVATPIVAPPVVIIAPLDVLAKPLDVPPVVLPAPPVVLVKPPTVITAPAKLVEVKPAPDQLTVCLAFTLRVDIEGGWSDNPDDPGGCTMKGVTLDVFREYCGNRNATPSMLRAITPAMLHAIYSVGYWNPCRCQDMPPGVNLMVFDAAVNNGPHGSARILQEVVGVVADGAIGDHTIAAVRAAKPGLIDRLAMAQRQYYQTLYGFDEFGTGWIRRVNARQAAAKAMVAYNK